MNVEQARANMVEQQIRTWDVLDQDVLDLLYAVPREEFVPPQHRALAFSDLQIPLGDSQRMWEPKMEARVVQELDVHKTDRVLEVGTGSGYLTALLAHRHAQRTDVELARVGQRLDRRVVDVCGGGEKLGVRVHGVFLRRDYPHQVRRVCLTGIHPDAGPPTQERRL